MSTEFFGIVHYDIWAQTYASKPFDATAQKTIRSIRGVREAQPLLTNDARNACSSYGLNAGSAGYDRCVRREIDARGYREGANQPAPMYRVDQYGNRIDSDGYRVDSNGYRMSRS